VNRPGRYLYWDGLTVREAVAAAGGFTSRANRRIVYIKHADERNETPNPLVRAEVRAGDTIRIPE
jgi:polysaccharide export outer membrane protein